MEIPNAIKVTKAIKSIKPNSEFIVGETYSSLIWDSKDQDKPTEAEFDNAVTAWNTEYDAQLEAYNNNEAIKATFDKTKKGARLSRKIDDAQTTKDFYAEHSTRTQEGADQGVNPNKGRMIEEGKVMKSHQPESVTEGSDRTFVGDDHGYDEYNPLVEDDSKLSTDKKKVELTGTDQDGDGTEGGDDIGEGRGMVETFTGSDLSAADQRKQANLQRLGIKGATLTNPVTSGMSDLILGTGMHQDDSEMLGHEDRDPIYEPTWWDSAKGKLTSWFNDTGTDQSGGDNGPTGTGLTPPESPGKDGPKIPPVHGKGEDEKNKFGGPRMKFGRNS